MSDDMPGGRAVADQRPGTDDDHQLFAASYAELCKLARSATSSRSSASAIGAIARVSAC